MATALGNIFNDKSGKIFQWFNRNNLLSVDGHVELFAISNPYTLNNIELPKNTTSSEAVMYLGTVPNNELAELIITELRDKIFIIASIDQSAKWTVKKIEKLSEPKFSKTHSYQTLSPTIISFQDHTANRYDTYMFPAGERYKALFVFHLFKKYSLIKKFLDIQTEIREPIDYQLNIKGKVESRTLVLNQGTIREEKVQSYQYFFDFTAPEDLHKIAYYLGIGEMNNLGFGMCNIL